MLPLNRSAKLIIDGCSQSGTGDLPPSFSENHNAKYIRKTNIAMTGQESDNLIGQMSRAFVGPKASYWNWRASSTTMAPSSKSSSPPPDLPDVARVNDLDDLGGGGERVKTNADWVGEDLHQSPPSISGCR